MKEIIVNTTSNELYDSIRYKARAIITNENNKIYIMNMNNSFNLPGGTFEKGENPDTTIKRELYEELGLKDINPIPFMCFKFYHDDFPMDDGKHYDKRLNVISCYLIKINSNDIGESHFTDYEIEHNDQVECHTIDEIIDLLGMRNDNVWKPFTDKELTYILKEYKRNI